MSLSSAPEVTASNALLCFDGSVWSLFFVSSLSPGGDDDTFLLLVPFTGFFIQFQELTHNQGPASSSSPSLLLLLLSAIQTLLASLLRKPSAPHFLLLLSCCSFSLLFLGKT